MSRTHQPRTGYNRKGELATTHKYWVVEDRNGMRFREPDEYGTEKIAYYRTKQKAQTAVREHRIRDGHVKQADFDRRAGSSEWYRVSDEFGELDTYVKATSPEGARRKVRKETGIRTSSLQARYAGPAVKVGR